MYLFLSQRANNSQLEGQVEVLLSFAKIEASVGLCVGNVVSGVAWPHIVSKQGYIALGGHFLASNGALNSLI